jgi:hypothetical protein
MARPAQCAMNPSLLHPVMTRRRNRFSREEYIHMPGDTACNQSREVAVSWHTGRCVCVPHSKMLLTPGVVGAEGLGVGPWWTAVEGFRVVVFGRGT